MTFRNQHHYNKVSATDHLNLLPISLLSRVIRLYMFVQIMHTALLVTRNIPKPFIMLLCIRLAPLPGGIKPHNS